MKTITTSYENPDLDGYGSAMAYAELLQTKGKDAHTRIWGTPHLEVQWFMDRFKLPQAKGPTDDTTTEVVLLDASSPDDLPKPLQVKQVIEIIDHRRINNIKAFPNAISQIELVGASATLVAERFKKENIKPSKESAMFLYGAIISNTENFTGISTDRDREMADWLKQISNAPDDLAQKMFIAKSDLSGNRLREILFGDLKTIVIEEKTFAIGQIEIIGVDKLLAERREEIMSMMKEIQKTEKSDYTFVNFKDLEKGSSKILCLDDKTAELLKDLPNLKFRKHIIAWIQEKLK
ncbi:DHH family phosphoesterase [Candidatus Uhrbacteria bacterium]|nr:DHH family phosphoesterase [Candidatus Uhrbacteria bacterium]